MAEKYDFAGCATRNNTIYVDGRTIRKGIENFLTGSLLEVRPMSVDKLQGLRPKISTVDEWLSGDIREDENYEESEE